MGPEKIRMWRAAETLLEEIDRMAEQVTALAPNAADHLERSAESALFNIAEGAGSFRPGTKVSAYEVAKKEANEVRAVLRRLVIKRVLTNADIARAYNLAGALVGMLTRAIISVSRRQP